ncbi:MAG: ribonuclease T2 family protein [Novosphingobium sp.]
MRQATFAFLIALAAVPSPALAQAYQCRVPQSIAMPRAVQPDGPSRNTPIRGYTLAVSWSPEFCRGPSARDPDNYQCNGRIGRFGFVLHGLWPESGQGKYPQWCSVTPRPSEAEIKANLCMTPVPWLIEHEWAKHGSCMAGNPADYLKISALLWNAVRLPDADRLSRKDALTAGDLRREFAALNPRFPKSSVGLVISNGGWLREIHLCYGKDFLPRACEKRAFGPKDDVPLKIWRGL